MKIIAKNTAIGTTAEDIISKGGTITLPTEARIHAIASTSTADDNDGTKQVEPATAAGTIVGINQVETATLVGTIGAAGEGEIDITVTGALIEGSPLTFPVAVANDDTPALMGPKVRAAMNALAAITTGYTVGGSGAAYSLTTKTKAANDDTLNIASATGTATGLTAAPSSVNTTAGHAGTGTVKVTITSAIYSEDAVMYVPVIAGDTPAVWAEKVRGYIATQFIVSDSFDVSGETDKIILTRKAGSANDGTLNIALENGTCNGVTTAASSANTTAGIAGTGAKTVEIIGVDELYHPESETVLMNGTTSVNTQKKYRWLWMRVKTAGTGGKNAGTLTATAETDNTVTCQIEADANVCEQAVYMVPASFTSLIKFFSVSASNATEGAVTTVTILSKKPGEVWIPEFSVDLDAANPTFVDNNTGLLPYLFAGTQIKVQAVASDGSSSVKVNMTIQ